jgi:dTDP-4-amino-4,6-dideoxygalactose transaminase
MSGFVELGQQFKVPIIEDAAQAIGARDEQGKPAGSRGTVGCFSFYPTKNLGGIGDGGMVTANDPQVAERLRKIRVHGERKRYYHDLIGFNSRLDALQAAVLNVKLRYLDGWSGKRRENARHYDAAFAAANLPGLVSPRPPLGMGLHIYHQYVIRVPAEHRDPLREHLRDAGIGSEVYYPVPLHLQECFEYLGYKTGDLPESEKAALETIALPIYPELTDEQLDTVAATIIAYLQGRVQVPATVSSENRPA